MRKIKYFVFDTNTLISAFILPNSTSRKALNIARKEGRILLSEDTANEFTDVFIRTKFDKYLAIEVRLEIIDHFKSLAVICKPSLKVTDCRDPRDNKFLELALAECVECIVTGDQDLLILNPYNQIPILTINEFLDSYKSEYFIVNEPEGEYQ